MTWNRVGETVFWTIVKLLCFASPEVLSIIPLGCMEKHVGEAEIMR